LTNTKKIARLNLEIAQVELSSMHKMRPRAVFLFAYFFTHSFTVPMLTLLKKHFGYDSFRPLQKEIIDTVLSGRDTLVLMPTGGGKSLCFQLPALTFDGITLVVSPLIALMKDQVDALRANGIEAGFINSSLSAADQVDVMKRATSGELKILYLAPERIGSYGFTDFLETLDVSLLAIDEAHCISEWGHDFRPDYRNLSFLRQKISSAPVIALTATATPLVREDILSQLGMKKDAVFVSSFNRENLHYSVRPKYNATGQLIDLLKDHKEESAIVYCFSRKNTEEVAQSLCRAGLPAAPYHAGLDKKLRIQTQERFIRDETPIIVATIAFGMGIDKPDVRMVVHMDLPKTIEGYYQETGRAGRDGLPSECVLFYSYADRRKQEYFINQIEEVNDRRQALQKLDDVVDYCQLEICRRFFLLTYFGEKDAATSCRACDNCTTAPTQESDATEISQKILSAVLRTGERFGTAHVCDVLRGSKRKRILELRHDDLSVHGIAKEVPTGALRGYVHALKRRGYLEKNEGEYPTLRVSQKGRQALVEKEEIMLPVQHIIEAKPKRVGQSVSDLSYNTELFEKLRALRKQIADDQNVPPFVIFGDKTLHEMAFYFPSTLDAFENLFGVGRRKLEAFGQEFLDCIVEFASEHGLEEKQVVVKASRSKGSSVSGLSSTLEETKGLLDEGLSVIEIANRRGLSVGTIVQHVGKLVHAGEMEVEDIDHLKPEDAALEEICAAFKSTGGYALTAVFQRLDEKYSYDELRLARMFL
jgi:ATP-dependent DNA helicase RecQ